MRPARELSPEEIRAQESGFRLFMPLEWLTVVIAPIAIPIAVSNITWPTISRTI